MNKSTNMKQPGFSNFGFSTILLAFVMICIVTIAALSLLTASSDYKLSQKFADKNSAYYKAEQQAYTYLSEIDSTLANAYQTTLNASGYYQKVSQTLSSMDGCTYDRVTKTLSYSTPINDSQHLEVRLLIEYPQEETSNFYIITSWKSISDEIEIDEGTLDLID